VLSVRHFIIIGGDPEERFSGVRKQRRGRFISLGKPTLGFSPEIVKSLIEIHVGEVLFV
jgi:hypothetical protein